MLDVWQVAQEALQYEQTPPIPDEIELMLPLGHYEVHVDPKRNNPFGQERQMVSELQVEQLLIQAMQ